MNRSIKTNVSIREQKTAKVCSLIVVALFAVSLLILVVNLIMSIRL